MKTTHISLCIAFFCLLLSGCEKDNGDDNDLPGEISFTNVALSNNNRNFVAKGITFAGADGYDGSQWQSCVDPDGATIRVTGSGSTYQGIEVAYSDFNTLIADVSDLPAISRVRVKFFNNCCPRLSVCGNNGVVASTTEASNSGENATMTLTFSKQQIQKVTFQSLEAIVESISIE